MYTQVWWKIGTSGMFVYIYVCVCVCVRMSASQEVRVYTGLVEDWHFRYVGCVMFMYIYIYICVCVCVCVCIYIYIHIYIYINTHVYARIHGCINRDPREHFSDAPVATLCAWFETTIECLQNTHIYTHAIRTHAHQQRSA